MNFAIKIYSRSEGRGSLERRKTMEKKIYHTLKSAPDGFYLEFDAGHGRGAIDITAYYGPFASLEDAKNHRDENGDDASIVRKSEKS